MKLEYAHYRIKRYIGIPFKEIPECKALNISDKGVVGKALERIIGLNNSSNRLDFDDGELKTNMAKYINGYPRETIFVMNISNNIDKMLKMEPFLKSDLYKKIRNVLYVPVYRYGQIGNWFFLPPLHVNLEDENHAKTLKIIKNDYKSIVEILRYRVNEKTDLYSHISGQYIQIRPHDSKPYNRIYSYEAKRYISNKNHGFYLKKEFMELIQESSPDYPFNHHKFKAHR